MKQKTYELSLTRSAIHKNVKPTAAYFKQLHQLALLDRKICRNKNLRRDLIVPKEATELLEKLLKLIGKVHRKLSCKWTCELDQELHAYHSIEAAKALESSVRKWYEKREQAKKTK